MIDYVQILIQSNGGVFGTIIWTSLGKYKLEACNTG